MLTFLSSGKNTVAANHLSSMLCGVALAKRQSPRLSVLDLDSEARVITFVFVNKKRSVIVH